MTNDELQAAIAANTAAISQLAVTVKHSNEQLNQALNFLVSEFIRPNAQQNLQSVERLERVDGIVEVIAQQQQVNAQQIASNAESITRFDGRLEETRQLVAKNASDIAQLGVKVDRIADTVNSNASNIAQLTVKQDRNAEAITRLEATQEGNANQIEALAELTRSQLAGIIGNSRRIDRIEQKAS